MTQAASINRAFELEIEKIGRAHRLAVIKVVRRTYTYIQKSWPIYSGYSKANNRISITGRTVARIQPIVRIPRKGAHIGKIASVETSELSKLDRLKTEKGFGKKPARTIIIGNAVRYAANLELSDSPSGRLIYEQARQVGAATRI